MTSKSDLIREWFNAIWRRDQLELIDEIFCARAQTTGPLSSIDDDHHYAREITENIKALIRCKPDISFPLIEEFGDWAFVRFIMNVAEHPFRPPFSFDGIMVFKFEADRIRELHTQINYFKLFEGLGQIPKDSLHICMTGAKLTQNEDLTESRALA